MKKSVDGFRFLDTPRLNLKMEKGTGVPIRQDPVFFKDENDGRYVLLNGFVGRKILEGIYYFDGADSSDDGKAIEENEEDPHRLCSKDLNPGGFREKAAFLGKAIYLDGPFDFTYKYAGASIYYMAFGDEAIEVLRRLYKCLDGYEIGFLEQNADTEKQESAPFIRRTDGYLSSSRRTIQIPEGACELVEGMGFHNLEVRCTLPFQKKKGIFSDEFKKFEVSYILDEKLYLLDFYVTEMRVKGYELNLRMIKELSVRYKAKLFDDVEENIVQTVIDRGEVEKKMIGEEDYGSYLKFINEERFYFREQ